LGSQEVSKPVVIAVIVLAVIIIGLIGWYFMRPQPYPGFQAPPGGAATGGPGTPGMVPGQAPGTSYPRTAPQ
jgi:hypothetical protein